MTIGPAEWQIAGIVVLVLVGISFLFWIVRAVIGWQRGRNLYVLPDSDPDRDDDDDNSGMDAR